MPQDTDTYICVLTLSAPVGAFAKAGVVEISSQEIRYDQLAADGATRVNPHAVNVALRTTQGLPANNAVLLADIEASLPPA